MEKQELSELFDRLMLRGSALNSSELPPSDDVYVFTMAGNSDEVLALLDAVGLTDSKELKTPAEVIDVLREVVGTDIPEYLGGDVFPDEYKQLMHRARQENARNEVMERQLAIKLGLEAPDIPLPFDTMPNREEFAVMFEAGMLNDWLEQMQQQIERRRQLRPLGDVIANAVEAIRFGVQSKEWLSVAEGLAMLLDDPRVQVAGE